MTPVEEIKLLLKRLGCIALTVVVAFGCLVCCFLWSFLEIGKYIDGDLARNQAESIRNWQLPQDTQLLNLYIFEDHPLRTHPEDCYISTNLILESALSADEIMAHYEQFSGWSFNIRREIEQLDNSSVGGSQFKVTFGVVGDYNC